ncbi:MAG: alternative ribosome rescue aminoacyl-tRNA hydrolase ArfB [Bacteroidales bacterium]
MRDCLSREVEYVTSRSSGPGGQHVNKTETRVTLLWVPARSACLGPLEKQRVLRVLAGRLTREGTLALHSERFSSQVRNREDVLLRFHLLVEQALRPEKKRIPTRATRAGRERRIQDKKRKSDLKKGRGGRWDP